MKKTIGISLIFIGIFAVVATMSIDTSVEVSSEYTGVERVNNLGKMNDKQNYLFISCIVFLSGMVLVGGDTEEVQEELEAIKYEIKVLSASKALANKGESQITGKDSENPTN